MPAGVKTHASVKPKGGAKSKLVAQGLVDHETDDDADEAVETSGPELDMIEMMQALQNRKKAKAASRSNEVSVKAAQLIESFRTRADDMKNEVEGTLNGAVAEFTRMKSAEVQPDFIAIAQLFDSRRRKDDELLEVYTEMIMTLSEARRQQVETTGASVVSFSRQRERSRKRLLRQAGEDLDQGLQNQRLATEAEAYIKQFKNLMRV